MKDTSKHPVKEDAAGDVTQEKQDKVGYPDISKANTKFIVIASLACIILILLLSVFFPTRNDPGQGTTEAVTTEQAAATEVDPDTGFTSVNGKICFFQNGTDPYKGWLTLDDARYYFDKNGVLVTGWYTIDGVRHFFDENGVMLTDAWQDHKYLDENGEILKNTFTPDGFYVDADGNLDDHVGLDTMLEGMPDLKRDLEDMLDDYSGEYSVYVKDLDRNQYLLINNKQYFSASLIKLFCAATVYDQIEKGNLEETESIDTLLHSMISISDNDAFNLLVMDCAPDHSHITGRGIIQDYIDANGYTDTTITSILVPTRYRVPSSPGRNMTTVLDCGLLLENIYKGYCVNEERSQDFLDLLLEQTHTNKIPAGLPEGTRCANKTGDTDEFQHDAAIVYSPGGDYILCVMSSNSRSSILNIRSISETVYTYFNPDSESAEPETSEVSSH